MKLLKKIRNWFYRVRVKNNISTVRILFFKYNRPIKKGDNKIYVPKLKNVGKHSYADKSLYCANFESSIGKFCSIGCRVVLGHGEHPLNFLSTSPYLYFDELGFKLKDAISYPEYWKFEPIRIENDVWIGEGVFVTIGNGAVVGARSVVTKDVPPYAIVAGNPAKILRYRFDEKTIAELLEIKWWDLDDEVIQIIPYDDIDKALSFLRKVRNK